MFKYIYMLGIVKFYEILLLIKWTALNWSIATKC
jgi:hypothetical protein